MKINYTHAFPNSISAEGNANNVLILRKLEKPVRRGDGKYASYEIEYRWLSVSCQNKDDEAWACTQGSEVTYWLKSELPIKHIKDNIVSLFAVLSLF